LREARLGYTLAARKWLSCGRPENFIASRKADTVQADPRLVCAFPKIHLHLSELMRTGCGCEWFDGFLVRSAPGVLRILKHTNPSRKSIFRTERTGGDDPWFRLDDLIGEEPNGLEFGVSFHGSSTRRQEKLSSKPVRTPVSDCAWRTTMSKNVRLSPTTVYPADMAASSMGIVVCPEPSVRDALRRTIRRLNNPRVAGRAPLDRRRDRTRCSGSGRGGTDWASTARSGHGGPGAAAA